MRNKEVVCAGLLCAIAAAGIMRAHEAQAGTRTFATPQSDPQILWSTYLGGIGYAERSRVAAAPDGDLVVAMSTTDDSWLAHLGCPVYQYGTLNGAGKYLVLRMSPNATTVRWVAELGGSGTLDWDSPETNQSVGVLADNTIAITGYATRGFPTTPGAFDSNFPTSLRYKGFLSRLTADGSSLIFSTLIGGSNGVSESNALAIDPQGRIVVAGRTDASDFPATGGAYQQTHGGDRDAFVASFTFTGTLMFATYLGGAANDECLTVDVDPATHAVVAGGYSGSAGLAGAATGYKTTLEGSTDGMLARFDVTLAHLEHFTYIGGGLALPYTYSEFIYAMRLEAGGPVAVLDTPDTTLVSVPGTWSNLRGNGDAYLFKLNSNWLSLDWATYAGGPLYDVGYTLVPLPSGDWALGGVSSGIDIVPGCGAVFPAPLNAFVERISPSEHVTHSVMCPGGATGYGLAVETNGTLVFGGDATATAGITIVPPSLQPALGGGDSDAFLVGLDAGFRCVTAVPAPVDAEAASAGALSVKAGRPDRVARRSSFVIHNPSASPLRLSVYDMRGREISTHVLEHAAPGEIHDSWDWPNDSSHRPVRGIYVVRVESGAQRATATFVLTP